MTPPEIPVALDFELESDLELEYASASESKLACLEAEAEAYEKRTELATVLGLSVAADWDSPAQLPVPLEQEDEMWA